MAASVDGYISKPEKMEDMNIAWRRCTQPSRLHHYKISDHARSWTNGI